MAEADQLPCLPGCGIVGDRFFDPSGKQGEISFFSCEVLDRLWDELKVPIERRDPGALHRNVLVEGADLNGLIGQEFELQGVRFRGLRECHPSAWMDQAFAVETAAWLEGRGGLRARILSAGDLRSSRAGRLAAVLLAEGYRDGPAWDPALVEISGRPLWLHQLDLLRAVTPRLAVAAPTRPPWLPGDLVWLPDQTHRSGALTGLLSGLAWAERIGATHLVLLAIHLPKIESGFLRALGGATGPQTGAIASHSGKFEPLAALYPIAIRSHLLARIERGHPRLDEIVPALVRAGDLTSIPVHRTDRFFPLNTPGDLALLSET